MRTAALMRCGLGLWLVACSPPNITQAEGKVAPPLVAPDPEPVACRPSPGPGAWARFPGRECDFELRDEGDQLVLSSLALDPPPPAHGEVPEPCRTRTCVYHGTLSAAGPLLVAVVPSPGSEMPSDVLLLVAHGERLASTSLWDGAGEPVESDFTTAGPAHALAPFVCGQALALLAVERLDPVSVPPPPTLRAREGRLDPAALVAAGDGTPAGSVDRSGCRPVDLPVP